MFFVLVSMAVNVHGSRLPPPPTLPVQLMWLWVTSAELELMCVNRHICRNIDICLSVSRPVCLSKLFDPLHVFALVNVYYDFSSFTLKHTVCCIKQIYWCLIVFSRQHFTQTSHSGGPIYFDCNQFVLKAGWGWECCQVTVGLRLAMQTSLITVY